MDKNNLYNVTEKCLMKKALTFIYNLAENFALSTIAMDK